MFSAWNALDRPGLAAGTSVPLEISYVDGVLRARAGTASATLTVAVPKKPARIFLTGAVHGVAVHRDPPLHEAGDPALRVGPPPPGPRSPRGRVFFLGDHSSNSKDSRYDEVGSVPSKT